MMPIERIPDWEKRLARMDAFWEGEIIDRPVVSIPVCRPETSSSRLSGRDYGSLEERWLDAGYAVDLALMNTENIEYYGDALPQAWPNLGPDVFAAFLGCRLELGEHTSWTAPLINDWSEADKVGFSTDNFCSEKTTYAQESVGKV
ncbi:MAG: hypothetical protein PHT33_07030 [bacterium]|nr:hypothetical protein [bacterium]